MKGTIFDLQRFSVHDGPGIRTTVFIKGCPLRCKWCHNPEGLNKEPSLQFFEEKCISCGACAQKTQLSDAEKCRVNALTVCGKTVDENEIIDEVLKDRSFYKNGGGVTFSGGECLLQADFVVSILQKLKGFGLHTAIDTSGYVLWEKIKKTLDFCDLYLYDVKCITSSIHKEYTGVDNALILENLKKLSECGKEIWVRVPVIPEFNNNEDEMKKIADFLLPLSGINQLTLMPYHTLGISKYKTLGLSCEYDSSHRITEKELSAFKEIFKSRNIKVV